MAFIYRNGFHECRILPFISIVVLCTILGGCGTLRGQPSSPMAPPLKVVGGPVIIEAPITKSTQIHSFEEDPSPEIEPILLAQLKEEIQITAQRFLTESLARQSGFIVVPFDETRRMLADLAPSGTMLTAEQVRMLGDQTGADVVVTGHIRDYGKVRWQYWLTGWGLSALAYVIAAGGATGWSPVAIGAVLAFDATTDFPVWYGGAEIFGWVFRPVRIHIDAVQMKNCTGAIWSDDEVRVWVPGTTLAEYPPDQQKTKEVQLEANLHQAMADLAETVGGKLRLQACMEDGRPEKIGGFSLYSLLDLLL